MITRTSLLSILLVAFAVAIWKSEVISLSIIVTGISYALITSLGIVRDGKVKTKINAGLAVSGITMVVLSVWSTLDFSFIADETTQNLLSAYLNYEWYMQAGVIFVIALGMMLHLALCLVSFSVCVGIVIAIIYGAYQLIAHIPQIISWVKNG